VCRVLRTATNSYLSSLHGCENKVLNFSVDQYLVGHTHLYSLKQLHNLKISEQIVSAQLYSNNV